MTTPDIDPDLAALARAHAAASPTQADEFYRGPPDQSELHARLLEIKDKIIDCVAKVEEQLARVPVDAADLRRACEYVIQTQNEAVAWGRRCQPYMDFYDEQIQPTVHGANEPLRRAWRVLESLTAAASGARPQASARPGGAADMHMPADPFIVTDNPALATAVQRVYPFDKMSAGKSFEVPTSKTQSVYTSARNYRLRHDPRFKVVIRSISADRSRVTCIDSSRPAEPPRLEIDFSATSAGDVIDILGLVRMECVGENGLRFTALPARTAATAAP